MVEGKQVHELTEDSDIKSTTKIVTKFGDGVELNYTNVSDLHDIMPPAGFINAVDEPYNCPTNETDDCHTAIQAAFDAAVTLNKAGVWLPGGDEQVYRTSDTILVPNGKTFKTQGCRIAYHSSFDYTELISELATRLSMTTPAEYPVTGWVSQAKPVISHKEGTVLLAQGQLNLDNVKLVLGTGVTTAGICAYLGNDTLSTWESVRIDNTGRYAAQIGGDGLYATDYMNIGSTSYASQEGTIFDNASNMRFTVFNSERHLIPITLTGGTTAQITENIHIQDMHFEMQAVTDGTCIYAKYYNNCTFKGIYVTVGSTDNFLHIPSDGALNHGMSVETIYTSSATGNMKMVFDEARTITKWAGIAGTGKDGYQQDTNGFIIPAIPTTGSWPATRDVYSVLGFDGMEISMGGGSPVDDLVTVKSSSNQTGNNLYLEATSGMTGDLLMTKDGGGTERFYIDSLGIPHNPSYSDGTRPTASSAGAGAVIFNTDDNFENTSDGTNWRDPTGAIT